MPRARYTLSTRSRQWSMNSAARPRRSCGASLARHRARSAVVAPRTDEGVPFGAGRRVNHQKSQERRLTALRQERRKRSPQIILGAVDVHEDALDQRCWRCWCYWCSGVPQALEGDALRRERRLLLAQVGLDGFEALARVLQRLQQFRGFGFLLRLQRVQVGGVQRSLFVHEQELDTQDGSYHQA